MIVLDASAAVPLLLGIAGGDELRERLARRGKTLHAPHLIDLEVLSTLRRFARNGSLGGRRAAEALEDWRDLRVARYPHLPFQDRLWTLRDVVSPYDAAYVVLAEALEAPLLTGDERLVRATAGLIETELVL